MEALDFKKMIEDLSVPDEVVSVVMKVFTGNYYHRRNRMTDEEKRVVVDIEELARRIRPAMMERFQLYVVKKFGY